MPLLPAPHTHFRYFCHIFRGLFFIPDAISSSAGVDGCPLGEETLLLCPECLLRGHQPLQHGGTGPSSPPTLSSGVTVVLPALQCWKGAGTCQSPWSGLGAWVVVFCFVLWKCAPWMPHCSWGWTGGLFSIWPESGLPNESQVNNTFFKKTIQMSVLEYTGN